MPSPYKPGRQACRKAQSNRELVMISRRHSDWCTWCPPNGGENCTGHHSKWGKKRAMRRAHTLGKRRKQWFDFVNKEDYGRYVPEYYDKGVKEGLYKSA